MFVRSICILAMSLVFGVTLALGQAAVSVEKGFNVGDGMVAYDTPYDPKNVQEMTFVSPSPEHPFYEIVVPMGDWNEGKSASIQSVVVNGVTSEAYYVFVNGFSHVTSAWITREKPTAKNVVLVTRSLWHSDEEITVETSIKATDEEGESKTSEKTFTGRAPSKGGGLRGWRRSQTFVAREKAGFDRENEPVEFSVAAMAENCGDLEKELRLCEYDPKSGDLTPVPFQTFNAKEFPGTPPGTSNPNYLQHPSRSVEVVFPATIPANESRVYAVFYDNPEADALDPPKTDLQISGPSLGATIENWYYTARLSEKSGQIASFDLAPHDWSSSIRLTDTAYTVEEKEGSSHSDREKKYQRLTNSLSLALHWNPDSFGDNGKWGHTFSWDPPDRTVVTTRGPLMFRITNSGRMPEYTPQVYASVSYTFYAGVPFVLSNTVMEVRDPFNASAIRNGEIVLDSHLITNFVWEEKNGEVQTVRTVHGPNWQDEWTYRVDHDVPWIALTHELDDYGIGEVILSSLAFNPKSGEATQHRPAFYLYYHHIWSTPLTYLTRGWVYPFSDYQRGPIIPIDVESTYVERMAFLPFPLHDSGNRYREIQEVNRRLKNPLEIRWGR